jgi:two-component system chemotaxis sensor kinase CheA
MDEEERELLRDFRDETRDGLAEIVNRWAHWVLGDRVPREALDSVFRRVHSIKGTAGFLGLSPIHSVAHSLESLLGWQRTYEPELTPAMLDALEEALEFIASAAEHALDPVALKRAAPRAEEVLTRVREVETVALLDFGDPSHARAERERIAFALADLAALTCPEGALTSVPASAPGLLARLEACFVSVQGRSTRAFCSSFQEVVAALRALVRGELPPLPELILALREGGDALKKAWGASGECQAALPSRFAAAIAEAREVARTTRLGDILVAQGLVSESTLADALEVQRAPLGEVLVRLQALSSGDLDEALEVQRQLRSGTRPSASLAPPSVSPRSEQVCEQIRVELRELERLARLVSELSTQLAETQADPAIYPTLEAIAGSVSALRTKSSAPVFQRLERHARELAQRQRKAVSFEFSGTTTRIHSRIVDNLHEPLLHLVRNALDHGLEDPEERRRSGKHPVGRLSLHVSEERERVHVVFADDGRGIDRVRLVQAAIDAGLLSALAAEELSEAAQLELVFSPGLTTASQVSDVSGRGVGMDVVRRRVVALGGRVCVSSMRSRGTEFVLEFPTAPLPQFAAARITSA